MYALTAIIRESYIFWDITPCSPLSVNRRFGGTGRLHLKGHRIIHARNQLEAGSKKSSSGYFLTGNVLVLFFDPEHGGDMLLRNVG
jgi:hypothetical protein